MRGGEKDSISPGALILAVIESKFGIFTLHYPLRKSLSVHSVEAKLSVLGCFFLPPCELIKKICTGG